jgi:hypothetical protein
MIDKNQFATQDMKNVVDKILKVMQSDDDEEYREDREEFRIQLNSSMFTPSTIHSSPQTAGKTNNVPLKMNVKSPKSPNFSPAPKSSTAASNSSNFESVYARMLAFQKRHDQERKKMQEKHDEEHRLIHTHTPTLNEKSRQLIRDVSPLHNRYQKEQELKEKRRIELIKRVEGIKEEILKKDLTFTPTTSRSSSSIRTTEEYYNYMKNWKQSKEMIGVRERKVKEDKVLEGVTFKPELNKNSTHMAKAFPKFEVRLEKGIQSREAKISEKKSASPCSFKPELQTRYKKVELGPVFERLYPNHYKNFSSLTTREKE